ncbi:hypothetical protein C0W45_02450 [Latilactobacillus curvatus]|nr:hypothetical protein C0W45_02450 [Latilactobacillus curvatus]
MVKHREMSVMKLLFILLLLSQYGFFMLIPSAKITRGLVYSPWIGLIIVLIMLSLISYTKIKDFGVLIVLFLAINVISFIWIIVQYKGVDSTAYTALGYAISSLLYFPIMKFKEKNDVYYLIALVNLIAVIIILLQVVFYNKTGQLIIQSIDVQKLEIRHGLRITYYDFIIMISFFTSITRLFGKHKYLYRINSILSLIYIIYVSQTRYWEVLMIAFFAVVGVSAVIADSKRKKIHLIYIFIAPVVILGLVITARSLFSSLIAPLLDGSYKGNGSYFARMGEIDFYTDVIKLHPFFGTGNLTSKNTSPLWFTLHGPQGIFYTQDIGLYGDIARLGLGILVIFILTLKKLLSKKFLNITNLGLIIMIVGSIGSISIFTNGFLVGLIFALLFENKELEG